MLIKSVIYVHLWLNLVVNEGEKIGAHFERQNHRFIITNEENRTLRL